MDFCLKNYVGIKICVDPDDPPPSGLYINSLPGLSVEVMDNIATSEQITYANLYSDAQDEAWQEFQTSFFAEVIKCYETCSNADDTLIDLICDNKKILVTAWRYLLGKQLLMYRLYSSRLNFFTMDGKEAENLYKEYGFLFQEALSKAVKILDMTSVKLPCGVGQIRTVTWLP